MDLVCLSHLRWDFVFQRPQHLLTRYNRGRVFFVEEPVFGESDKPELRLSPRTERVKVAVPHLPHGLTPDEVVAAQARLLDGLLADHAITDYVRWHYTPASLPFSRHLNPRVTVYDCMDELSHFKGASPELKRLERELFDLADLVFTGGISLFEAKQHLHGNIHPFPSSVDVTYFNLARQSQLEPHDQREIPHPRVGYYGVIDERLDLELLAELADLRPDLHLVMVGPVCKIDQADLPRRPNLHYLGPKDYGQLATYLAGWDVAMMPFARNDATRFISPTKTPEYLAGGKPVVSTSIRDVIRPYQALGLVHIADSAPAFASAIEAALAEDSLARLKRADRFLEQNSWDATWHRMQALIDAQLERTSLPQTA